MQSSEQDAIGPHVLAPGVEIPASINMFLRPYQRDGAAFMYKHYAANRGSINGDDMGASFGLGTPSATTLFTICSNPNFAGLGKTIQVIAFLSAVMGASRHTPCAEPYADAALNAATTGKKGRSKYDVEARKTYINSLKRGKSLPDPSDISPTCLIACPASVVHNWAREFQTVRSFYRRLFYHHLTRVDATQWGYFDVGIYEGNKEQKREVLKRFRLGYLDVREFFPSWPLI